MSSNSKNNFKGNNQKKNSKYKLWVKYHGSSAQIYGEKVTYYGFNTKPDGGLASLIRLAEARQGMYTIAILYDNMDKKEIQRWEGVSVPNKMPPAAIPRRSRKGAYTTQRKYFKPE